MAFDNTDFKNILGKLGLKNTKQRVSVMEVLADSEVPLTAEQIYMRLHEGTCEECSSLSLSTVYRVLDLLVRKGVISKNGLIDGGKALYEVVTGMHRHNLVCIKCHKTIPIENCPIGKLEKDLEKTTGFEISGHKLEIYGICPDCK